MQSMNFMFDCVLVAGANGQILIIHTNGNKKTFWMVLWPRLLGALK